VIHHALVAHRAVASRCQGVMNHAPTGASISMGKNSSSRPGGPSSRCQPLPGRDESRPYGVVDLDGEKFIITPWWPVDPLPGRDESRPYGVVDLDGEKFIIAPWWPVEPLPAVARA